jgi:hypothetical protein
MYIYIAGFGQKAKKLFSSLRLLMKKVQESQCNFFYVLKLITCICILFEMRMMETIYWLQLRRKGKKQEFKCNCVGARGCIRGNFFFIVCSLRRFQVNEGTAQCKSTCPRKVFNSTRFQSLTSLSHLGPTSITSDTPLAYFRHLGHI